MSATIADVDELGLIPLDEAARLLGVTLSAAQKAVRRRTLPARKIGRQWLTTRDDVAVYRVEHSEERRRARADRTARYNAMMTGTYRAGE